MKTTPANWFDCTAFADIALNQRVGSTLCPPSEARNAKACGLSCFWASHPFVWDNMTKACEIHTAAVITQVLDALDNFPFLIKNIPKSALLHRIQDSRYDASPVHYKADSDSRFADPDQKVGVYYLGLSAEVAVAESFQSGHGVDDQAVCLSRLVNSSLHRLKTSRTLRVVDVVGLANRSTNHKLKDLVQAKGQGRQGYSLTRRFSKACMGYGESIDGILYPSAVYTETGTLSGCNIVLFEGRGIQVKPVSHRPLLEVQLSNGQTPLTFLESMGVVLE